MAQLQMLAERGSRRARAELDRRLREQGAAAAPVAPVPPMASTHAARTGTGQGAAVGARIPTLTTAVHTDGATAPSAPARPVPVATADDPDPQKRNNEALALQVLAQHGSDRSRADGPPRLMGMVLIGWGALLLLGSLTMLGRAAGWYYLYCGAGAAAVGWLLLRCSRWAMALHGALLLVALAWAWRSNSTHSIGLALVQTAPLLVAALWMAVRPVREPLD